MKQFSRINNLSRINNRISRRNRRASRRLSRRNRRTSRRLSRRNNRISRRKRKSRRRSRRRSMKGGEMSRLKKIGIGATTAGLVGAAAGAGAKMALGGDKISLATTLGGAAVGAAVGAGIGELKARTSMKIYATQINIKIKSTANDNYNPEYIGFLNKIRLSQIFDRKCPYNRDVFNKLFSKIKTKLQTRLHSATMRSDLLLFGTDGMVWNSNGDKSRSYLAGLITCCIYVISDSNTLIISVITGNFLKKGEHCVFTEVIPSYYLLPNMTACIQQNNPLVETKVSDAFSLYSDFSDTTIDDSNCPKSQINRALHQEPELDRWIIPREVQINII